jgi:low affinity Fe/Cu permease
MMSKVSDAGDKFSAHPFFLIVFNVLLVAMWLKYGVDYANIFISIITAEIVMIGASAGRRGFSAIHAKLDEIIHAISDARDDLIDVEKLTEPEIEALRCHQNSK